MVTKGIDPWQSALFIREQRLRLKATIACFGAVHNLLFGERNRYQYQYHIPVLINFDININIAPKNESGLCECCL